MIKIVLLLTINVFIFNRGNIIAQTVGGNDSQTLIQYVDNLCYKTIRHERINVSTELNIETITQMERIKFQTKELIQEHREYFSETGYYTHKIIYDTSINYYPKWYKVADSTVFDDNGITNYYVTPNEYYEGGWPGGGRDTSYYGTFYTNLRTGEKTYVEGYSQNAKKAYLRRNDNYQEKGLLYGKVFKIPTDSQLAYYSSMGYTIEITATTITVYNSEMKVIWDVVNKYITKEWYEDGVLVSKKIVKYVYNETLDVEIVTQVVEMYPGIFENGDCYDEMVITDFKDYTLCGGGLKFRGKNSSFNAKEAGLVLSPNPVIDELEVEFPVIKEEGQLEIVTLTGKVLKQVKLARFQKIYKINLNDLTAGIYLVKVMNNEKTFVKKFVKQKK